MGGLVAGQPQERERRLYRRRLIFYPISRFTITPIANQSTVEGHPDLGTRGVNGAVFPATRTTGLQLRGWTLGKRIGFRGGIYEGVQGSAGAGLNPKSSPAFGALVNFDLIGSEEGGYLYPTVNFRKAGETVLSLSVASTYQSNAIRVTKGVTDQRSLTSTLYLDMPVTEQQELVAILGGYLYGNGSGSRDTGVGASIDLGYRYRFVRPYVAFEYFASADCPTDGSATTVQCAAAHTGDSRNFRAGLDFYANKNLNHLQLEFSLNRGQSSWGEQSVAAANAGYVPKIPVGEPAATSLARTASKSLLLHWHVSF